ncbi:hypothetical protein QZQ97_17800 [Serratia sp. root2]|uniref:hypothetical protein n=1 Tax=Serratia sp. root2 TaxID=3059676 RepID=UPI00288DE873|nr:hypothetical protein [Serratia sp. root2]MDT3252774.1 hypothetical protein [Serratia sp. root2]
MTRLYSPSVTGRLNQAKPEWSQGDIALLMKHKDTLTAAAIGNLMTPPRSRSAVISKANKLHVNLTARSFTHFTTAESEFIENNAGKIRVKEMAEKLGKPECAIRKHANYKGIKLRIPNDDIYLVHQLRTNYGLSYSEIAKKFEVSTGTIFYWCRKLQEDQSITDQTNEVTK